MLVALIEHFLLQALDSELQMVRIFRAELREEYAFAFDHLDGKQKKATARKMLTTTMNPSWRSMLISKGENRLPRTR